MTSGKYIIVPHSEITGQFGEYCMDFFTDVEVNIQKVNA